MNKWIVRPKINNKAHIRLFCFPYAGSSSVVTYKFLVDSLSDSFEVCPVEFPGRGSRMSENLIGDIDIAVNQISDAIVNYLDKPYIFFGHSMGALIAFELSRLLWKKYGSKPLKLYLSAHRAPDTESGNKLMHLLDHEELLNELIAMDGLAPEILQHKELLELVLPIIRNDYRLCETYQFRSSEVLDIPIHVFGGSNDKDIEYDHLRAWKEFTSADFNLQIMEGDHFYITKNKENFLKIFSDHLNSDLIKLGIF